MNALRLRYAWLKTKGWLAYQIVRWLPLPWNLNSRCAAIICRLWGVAYYAGAVACFADYRDVWRRYEQGQEPTRAWGEEPR